MFWKLKLGCPCGLLILFGDLLLVGERGRFICCYTFIFDISTCTPLPASSSKSKSVHSSAMFEIFIGDACRLP